MVATSDRLLDGSGTQGVTTIGSQVSSPVLFGSGSMYLTKWPQIAPFLTSPGAGSLLAHSNRSSR